MGLPLSRQLNLIWFWLTDGQDPKDVDRFKSQLWRPPAGEEGQGVWSAEAENDGLAAFAAETGVG